MTSTDDIWDDLFHGCAWAAYIDQAHAKPGRPDSETTRQRAFQYYEEELAKKNRPQDGRAVASGFGSPSSDEL
jgi:hypothetical protein